VSALEICTLLHISGLVRLSVCLSSAGS